MEVRGREGEGGGLSWGGGVGWRRGVACGVAWRVAARRWARGGAGARAAGRAFAAGARLVKRGGDDLRPVARESDACDALRVRLREAAHALAGAHAPHFDAAILATACEQLRVAREVEAEDRHVVHHQLVPRLVLEVLAQLAALKVPHLNEAVERARDQVLPEGTVIAIVIAILIAIVIAIAIAMVIVSACVGRRTPTQNERARRATPRHLISP